MTQLRRGIRLVLMAYLRLNALMAFLVTKVTGFHHMSAFIGTIPFGMGERFRYLYYKRVLGYCGSNVRFCGGCHFAYPNVRIGSNVRIGYGSSYGLVDIGDDVIIGAHSTFTSGSRMHSIDRTDIPMRLQKGRVERISVGNDVWVGTRSVVMASLGDGVVVGSGSVVTRPIPAYGVAVGNPARVIRFRKDAGLSDPQ